jgi:hypothetical protein
MLLCGECYENVWLQAHELFIVQERWTVCTPLGVKVFATVATQ